MLKFLYMRGGYRNTSRLIGFILAISAYFTHANSLNPQHDCLVLIKKANPEMGSIFRNQDHHIRRLGDNLSMLHTGSGRTDEHEMAALERVSSAMPEKNFLLATEMRGFRSGIPIFDGVIYNSDGNPETNFSLKSILIDEKQSDNFNKTYKSAVNFARSKFRSFYQHNWMSRKGFSYSNERWKLKKNNKFNHHSNEYINNFAKIFGVEGDKTRPGTIMVDFYSKETASVKLGFIEAQEPHPGPAIAIDVKGYPTKYISILSVQDMIKNTPHIESYIISGGEDVIVIKADSFEFKKVAKK